MRKRGRRGGALVGLGGGEGDRDGDKGGGEGTRKAEVLSRLKFGKRGGEESY